MIVYEEKKKKKVPAKNQKDKSQSSKQIFSSYASNSRKNNWHLITFLKFNKNYSSNIFMLCCNLRDVHSMNKRLCRTV